MASLNFAAVILNGRPPLRPRARADAKPASVRSEMSSRSNSALCGAPHNAQFERRPIQERTKAGLTAARARGRKGGRRPTTGEDPRVKTAQRMYAGRALSVKQICKTLAISRARFYRYLAVAARPESLA
jgi:hypothetical protein